MALYEVSFKGLRNKTVKRLRDSKAEAVELQAYLERHGIKAKMKLIPT